ncbi:hypothetical protein D3C75_1155020 [compost metagenome]
MLEQFFEARDILRDFRVDFGVASIQIGVGYHNLAAMARTFNIEHIQIIFGNDTVKMGINKVLAGNGSPVSNRLNLDIRILQRFS